MKREKMLKFILLLLALSVPLGESRGGRGRGGGSFGGLFGGWRKYKKPASSGSSRRTVNSSPIQSTVPKSTSGGASMSSATGGTSIKQPVKQQTKTDGSYPKQQMTNGGNGYTPMGGYYGAGGAGAAHLPPGSQYYANTAAMPAGAIYYAQPPMRTSGTGDFLMGMMTGHMVSSMLFPRPYATHIIHQQAPQQQNQGSKVIIINAGNNTETATNTTDTNMQPLPKYWPTDTDVPLAPFNSTIPHEAVTNAAQNLNPAANNKNDQQHMQSITEGETSAPTAAQAQGIICVPMLFNETDPNDATKTVNIEKIVCFPAPPPPPPQALATSSALTIEAQHSRVNCITGIFVETDPNDPTKTIDVKKQKCRNVTLTPEEIVGEIGENTNK